LLVVRPAIAISLALFAACGDDASMMTPDTGVDAGGLILPVVAPPAPPVLTPCPEGWLEESDAEGVIVCEPWPGGAAEDCAPFEVHLPGTAGCAPIGDACPAGDFADGLADDGSVLFVRAGATPGDGSRASPFGTISAALAAAGTGSVIALSKGRFDERVSVGRAVEIRGACVAETEVVFTATVALDAVVTARVEGVVLRDFRVGESPHIGIAVRADGGAELSSILVDRALEIGVLVAGGQLVGDRLVVNGTLPSSRGFGRGLDVEDGGTLEATRVSLSGNTDRSAFAGADGSRLALTGFAIADTQAAADGSLGWGAFVTSLAAMELRQGVIEGSREGSIAVFEGSSFIGSDLVLRDTLGRESDDAFGCGVALERDGHATFERVHVERVRDAAFVASGPATLTLTDAVIEDIQPQASDGLLGRGLSAQAGATVEMSRVVISRTRNIALFVVEPDTAVTASDVSIRNTTPGNAGSTGWGVFMRDTSTLVARRFEVLASRDLGIHVSGAGTTFDAMDLLVRDTESREVDGAFGRGIDVELGATATIERAIVERARNAGVFVGAVGTTATLRDVAILDVSASDCAPASCREIATGAGAYAGARLSLDEFTIARAGLCGVHVAIQGELDLLNGEVAESTIGACVSVPDYDLSRLTTDVRYRDNDVSLDTDDALPVPVPAPPIED